MNHNASDNEIQNRLKESIGQVQLANGLRIVTERVPSIQSVTLGIQIETGSRDESHATPGIAHFTEHALFKGTSNLSCLDIARNSEMHGGYIDAYTTKEHTCLYIRTLPEHLASSFALLAELVTEPLFPVEEINREIEVVLEEITSVNDAPEEMIVEEFDKRALPDHPLGSPILGTKKSIRGISSRKLKKFVRQYYRPGNMILTATGQLEHEAIATLADRYLGHTDDTAALILPRTPFLQADYHPFEHSKRIPFSQAQLIIGTMLPRHDPHYYSLMLLNMILGEGMSSILNMELREKRGLVYSALSSIMFFSDMTTLNISAGSDSGKTEKIQELVMEILNSDAFRHPAPETIATAKTRLLGLLVMEREKMTRRMSQTASDLSYFGRYVPLEEKKAAVAALTPEKVGEAADSLCNSPMSSLIYKPR